MKGRWAEDLALSHLEKRGYRLVARNRRTPFGEIDLWMKQGRVHVFVEVKQRRGPRYGHPAEAITQTKRHRMRRSALFLLGRDDLPVRFEAVLVYGTPKAYRIEVLPIDEF